jgi:hypothetical protein
MPPNRPENTCVGRTVFILTTAKPIEKIYRNTNAPIFKRRIESKFMIFCRFVEQQHSVVAPLVSVRAIHVISWRLVTILRRSTAEWSVHKHNGDMFRIFLDLVKCSEIKKNQFKKRIVNCSYFCHSFTITCALISPIFWENVMKWTYR